jgi:O-antigen ligase
LIFVILSLVAIVPFTRSRTQLAALLLALSATAARRWLRPQSRIVFGALLLSAGLAFWIFIAPWAADSIDLSRMTESELAVFLLRGQTVDEFATISGRLGLWQAAVPIIMDSPFVGNGYLASRAVLQREVPWASYAHNGAVQSLLDLGVLGAILIWGLALRTFVKAARSPIGSHRVSLACGQFIFGILVFQLLTAGAGESFVGTPGFRVFVFCTCALLADRIWVATR